MNGLPINSKHTQGEFLINPEDPYEITSVDWGEIGLAYDEPPEWQKATARLFAASPDLFLMVYAFSHGWKAEKSFIVEDRQSWTWRSKTNTLYKNIGDHGCLPSLNNELRAAIRKQIEEEK